MDPNRARHPEEHPRAPLTAAQAVLAPSAVIVGPAALDLKSGVLPDEAVHWLKANFFKTELELGHCLRMPAEGPPGVCDLCLTNGSTATPNGLPGHCGPSSRWPRRRPRSAGEGTCGTCRWPGTSPTSLAGGFTALRLSGAGRVRIVPRARLVP